MTNKIKPPDKAFMEKKVENLSFGLSETQPIKVFNKKWTNKTYHYYDMHYAVELGIVLSGKSSRHYKNADIDLTPGNIWLCNMWEPHGFEITKTPCEIVYFMIFPPMLAKMHFEESNKTNWLKPFYVPPCSRPQITKNKTKKNILSIMKNAKNIITHSQATSPLWLRVRLLEILLIINDQWEHTEMPDKLPTDSFERINRAIQMVFDTRERLTTQTVAKKCGMTRNAFSSLFLRLMGIKYTEFGLRFRISAVANDLRKTSTPIKAIATHWGFTDACHLHHCFKRYYNCSPSKYRNINGFDL